jgi:hypothetical protein
VGVDAAEHGGQQILAHHPRRAGARSRRGVYTAGWRASTPRPACLAATSDFRRTTFVHVLGGAACPALQSSRLAPSSRNPMMVVFAASPAGPCGLALCASSRPPSSLRSRSSCSSRRWRPLSASPSVASYSYRCSPGRRRQRGDRWNSRSIARTTHGSIGA